MLEGFLGEGLVSSPFSSSLLDEMKNSYVVDMEPVDRV